MTNRALEYIKKGRKRKKQKENSLGIVKIKILKKNEQFKQEKILKISEVKLGKKMKHFLKRRKW